MQASKLFESPGPLSLTALIGAWLQARGRPQPGVSDKFNLKLAKFHDDSVASSGLYYVQ
jgi:hypothetical protein